MTSSAASDTERARKRTFGPSARTASITPVRRHPACARRAARRRASASRIAGHRHLHRARVADDLGGRRRAPSVRRTEQLVVVDHEHADASRRPGWLSSAAEAWHLSPRAGPAADHEGGATAPLQAADDRVGDAPPVGSHRVGVKAAALVPNEGRDRVILDLDVDRGVGRARAAALRAASARRSTRAGSRSSSSASPTTTASTFTWCCRSTRPAIESIASRSRAPATSGARPVQPARSSRSCVRARLAISRGSFERWIRRQRLEHRVVEVRGHLGSGLGPDAPAALLDELAAHAPCPRTGAGRRPADRHDDRQQDVPAAAIEVFAAMNSPMAPRGSARTRSRPGASRPASPRLERASRLDR